MAERGDRYVVAVATLSAACVIAQQVGAKATRDALFLSQFGLRELAYVMLASAGLSLFGVMWVSKRMGRTGPAQTVPAAFLLNSALFLVEWALVDAAPASVAVAVYLHAVVFGLILISGFWTVVNERFDPHRIKQFMGRFVGGATFGGVVGGGIAERCAAFFGVRAMLLVLAVLSAACAAGVAGVARGLPADSPETRVVKPGWQVIREKPYLRHFAALTMLTSLAAVLAEYALKAEAMHELRGSAQLMRFFSVFYAGTNLLTFIIGALFSKKALERLGLGGTVAVLPAAVVLTGVLAAGVTRLWSTTILAGVERTFANSLFRSGYELLFTPLPRHTKRPTKAIIDVVFDRAGEALGGGVVLVALLLAPSLATTVVVVSAAAFSAVSLWLCRRLQDDYAEALVDALRKGAVRLERADVRDATTLRALTDTQREMERAQLINEIERLRAREGGREEPPAGGEPEKALHGPLPDLRSGDADRVRRALAGELKPGSLPIVFPLLARTDVRDDAVQALRKLAPQVVDALVELMLDPSQSLDVRKRVPMVLKVCHEPAAVEGLLKGLGDPRFAVRYESAQALSDMMQKGRDITLPVERVLGAVQREFEVDAESAARHRRLEPEESSPWLDSAVRDRVDRNVEHVFTILSFVLDSDALGLVLRALESDDERLRGTAREWVENVVPEPIRSKLWRYLDEHAHDASSGRTRATTSGA